MIEGNKKRNLYEKILKLTNSTCKDDLDIARILIIDNMAEFSPSQFESLRINHFMNNLVDYNEEIELQCIQKHFYDKRKEEKRANKRRNIQKDQSL